MQVNLPSALRKQLEKRLQEARIAAATDEIATIKEPSLDVSLSSLAESFHRAYREIRRLIANDSWPRFTKSVHFKQVCSSATCIVTLTPHARETLSLDYSKQLYIFTVSIQT
jgi:hypothetical protein